MWVCDNDNCFQKINVYYKLSWYIHIYWILHFLKFNKISIIKQKSVNNDTIDAVLVTEERYSLELNDIEYGISTTE